MNDAILLQQAVFQIARDLELGSSYLELLEQNSSVNLFQQNGINPATKEGRIGHLLLRVYVALSKMFGNDLEQMRGWLHCYNKHLKDKPVNIILNRKGLYAVLAYLERFLS